jgi:hypothetical protein
MSLDGVDPTKAPSGEGCLECLRSVPLAGGSTCAAAHIAVRWAVCESSPSQHARAHFRDTGHRYIQSYEPGEDWFWDFVRDDYASGPILAPPRHHPTDQPVPGPAGRGLVRDCPPLRLNCSNALRRTLLNRLPTAGGQGGADSNLVSPTLT